ncbi:MAG: phosphoenolpyruvate synthase [Prevotellaceae bacterium]|nr:phosphoenolpyruvate synthase [Prevotellaceae bacterium]
MTEQGTLPTLSLRDTRFTDLMSRRIFNVLLLANPYDAFMLEDDGRIDEKIFREYASLGLRYPPRFIQVSSHEQAEEQIRLSTPDLIICMPATNNNDVFESARRIKEAHEEVPIVVLTPFSHGVSRRLMDEDLSIFEYVFCWLGNTDLLLSIIKLIEDKMNLRHDIEAAGVNLILLVEDNIRFYSSLLPSLYKFVLQQSLEFATEALNSQLETLRMRGRPKIVLARTYEEAWDIYSQFPQNTLGVISDCRFPREGKVDEKAGLRLLTEIRKLDPYLPLVLESSEKEAEQLAWQCGAGFIDKSSKTIDVDLREILSTRFGFGDFIFRDPTTMQVVCRVHNLKELQDNIFKVPGKSLLYHISHNNVSRWLCSRALFSISEFLKKITWESLQDIDAHRQIIFDAIVSYRKMKNQGVVAVFQKERFDRYSNFARIGDGSLGGKGRGLAFLDNIIKRHPSLNSFEGVRVSIPKTVVLCTDVFDEFMDTNGLYQLALSPLPDEEILRYFLRARMPARLLGDLTAFLEVVRQPIAIRSSSLLEDSHYQPFAGVYSTYMIPYAGDKYERLETLSHAIKAVYASVFYQASKDYMTATSNVIDREKMAVILQEVAGQQHGNRYYPNISGVARSLNYYPLGDELPEEGTVNLALGLGKYIVDGGKSLRLSPYHPDKILQTSETELALRETQTHFLSLDLANTQLEFRVDDGFNLARHTVRDAEEDGSLQWIVSTYDPADQMIYDGFYPGRNRKILSFCGVLQHGVIPLPELLQSMLRIGQQEMQRPVEMEFAVCLAGRGKGEFYPLQIRPMVDQRMSIDEDISKLPQEQLLLSSPLAIGHGTSEDVVDVVYVRTSSYSPSANPAIAEEIERENRQLLNEGRGYVLVGPGRWGSSDPWLGVPVKWPHISAARVIVELALESYQVDPSQGTHFFQNLTSLGVSYFTVNLATGSGSFRESLLEQMPAVTETQHIRHVRFPQPLTIMVDGLHRLGAVILPQD